MLNPLLTTLLLASNPANAEGGGPTIGLYGGWMWTAKPEVINDTWVVVPRLGYMFNERWGAELDIGYAQGVTRTVGNPYTVWDPRLNLVAMILTDAPVRPFVAIGGGIIHKNVTRSAGEAERWRENGWGQYVNPDLDGLLNVGPGIMVKVVGPLWVRADYRLMLNLGSEPHGSNPDAFLDHELTAGLHLRFGEGEDDADGDGYVDSEDGCPDDPEDFDNFEDADGCPDPDNDRDRILDVDDRCPNDPEDYDTFEDQDGCPDPDNDGDGILDVDDKCPLEAGVPENQGCPPDQGPPPPPPPTKDKPAMLDEECSEIVVLDLVFFDWDMAVIRPDARLVLDEVAKLLKEHPEILLVEVGGHASAEGSDAYNQNLSQRRAESVIIYLTGKGVAPNRLTPRAYGEEVPRASNEDESGRSQNRRGEFRIVRWSDRDAADCK